MGPPVNWDHLWAIQCAVVSVGFHCPYFLAEGASKLDSLPPRDQFLEDFLTWLGENGVDHHGVEVVEMEGKGMGLRTRRDLVVSNAVTVVSLVQAFAFLLLHF